jgi:hypothetical protein
LAAAWATTALAGLALFVWSVRLPFRAERPMPRLVRVSFGVFVVLLVGSGTQLVGGSQAILPWEVTRELAVLYGWYFIGAAAYFAYGVARPVWHNAVGQLLGFLAYDLVLIGLVAGLLPAISDERRASLFIYLAVLTYSALLAVYYVFVSGETGILAGRLRTIAAPDGRAARGDEAWSD